MNTTEETRGQFRALTSHLGGQQTSILECWRIAAENEPDCSIASSLTWIQFNDHVRGFLDAFAHELLSWPDEKNAQARKHGMEEISKYGMLRWQQGYQLSDLVREWGHLQEGVMLELEVYALAHPGLEQRVMTTARLMWMHLCCDGISSIAAQYARLHKADAAAHLRDLEQALFTARGLDRARAAAWREAAHDMRGSMNAVSLAASALEGMNDQDPMRHECSGMLQRGVTSLEDMLHDLMSLARLDAGLEERKIAPFDAGMQLSDFCMTSLPLAQARGLFFKVDGPVTLPVQGDGVKVQRILQNLVLNALKYTQHGGVTVIWGAPEERETRRWMFSVKDTGPGLQAGPEALPSGRLLQATQIAHAADENLGHRMVAVMDGNVLTLPAQPETPSVRSQRGEGVGLSIVKRLCDLLDATLELETVPGIGSTFRVTLPMSYEVGVRAGEQPKAALHAA